VDGISIATRPDCLSPDVLNILTELNRQTRLTVELGLQTIHNRTAELIRRGCSYDDFLRGYYSLKERAIRVCVHIINGLPEESEEDMINTAKTLGQLFPDGIKIHLLHVMKDTQLEKLYLNGQYTPMEKESYVAITVKQLEYLPQTTVIERITGDGDKRYLIAPLWSNDKISVLGAIDKLQKTLDTYQGKNFK